MFRREVGRRDRVNGDLAGYIESLVGMEQCPYAQDSTK